MKHPEISNYPWALGHCRCANEISSKIWMSICALEIFKEAWNHYFEPMWYPVTCEPLSCQGSLMRYHWAIEITNNIKNVATLNMKNHCTVTIEPGKHPEMSECPWTSGHCGWASEISSKAWTLIDAIKLSEEILGRYLWACNIDPLPLRQQNKYGHCACPCKE